jgi:hypothetical protein
MTRKKDKVAVRRKFLLRLDDDIREALERVARRNDRSITAEIRHRLRRSIEATTAA